MRVLKSVGKNFFEDNFSPVSCTLHQLVLSLVLKFQVFYLHLSVEKLEIIRKNSLQQRV